jgi:hypothetical protein
VELGRHWYDREMNWKMTEASALLDMKNAPYAEPVVSTNTQDKDATAARTRLQGILDQLDPEGGIMDPGDGSGKHANRDEKKAKKQAARKKARSGVKSNDSITEPVNGPND